MIIEKINELELYFDPEVDPAVEIKGRVLVAYKKNSLFFGHSLANKCAVHIIYNRAEMDKVLGIKTESWLVGTTTTDGSIHIFSPMIFDKVSSHIASNFDLVLTHELAHIFINESFKFYQPIWLNEGLAGHIAEQYKNKQPKKLSDFEKLHNREDWINTPNYAQASCFTSFLIEKLGENEFLQFLKTLSQNNSAQENFTAFSKLFTECFNISFKQFILEWQKKVLPQQKKLG